MNQITSFDNVLVSEVLTVMRHLIQRDPAAHRKTVVRLARNLDRTTSSEARATIIWLVGEFAGLDRDNNIAPDVLRILVKDFADESEDAKQQIVLLGAKVYLQYLQDQPKRDESHDEGPENGYNFGDDQVPKVWTYLSTLVRYDTSFDLRDRMRLFKALLANPSSTQLASLMISAPKPVPHTPSPSETRQNLTLGTTTLALGKDIAGINGLPGYLDLPEWVQAGQEPDPKLRDESDGSREEYVSLANRTTTTAASQRLDEAIREQGLENTVAVKRGKNSSKSKTLDDWLDESEDEEEEEESETESEEESDSGEEETDSEEEDEESEEDSRRTLMPRQ